MTAFDYADIPQDGPPTHWFASRKALEVLRHLFQAGHRTIRIATGYFTVRGYTLLRRAMREKEVFILVGLDEPGERRVRQALIAEILHDLRTGIISDRRQVVTELVERLKGGQFSIVDARALQHHEKLYLIDTTYAVIGSANMTGRGLQEAIEAGNVIEEQDRVTDFVGWYDEYFYAPHCINISQTLIDALSRWLQLARPWEVYLKTLHTLKHLDETKIERPQYHQPVGYQRVVIARALRQIEEWRGAMIVASTGLGKTIMGTDIAFRLHERGVIRNVMVIGPKTVEQEWTRRFRSAGESCAYFIHQALDAQFHRKQAWHKVAVLDECLAELDREWLIIIDESHEFRNRYQTDLWGNPLEERQAFQRQAPAIKQSGCHVLLLTGTPYAKELENINHQLYLLPHTAPLRQPHLPLLEDTPHIGPWMVTGLQDLKDCPVGSVITTPHVAKYYGVVEGTHTAIQFHEEKRYIPHMQLYRVDVPPPLEEEIATVLNAGYLRVSASSRHLQALKQAFVEKNFRVAWGSSPWALIEMIERVLADKYQVTFAYSQKERYAVFSPILEQLRSITAQTDIKMQWLGTELERLCANNQQVIVFSEPYATVAYQEHALAELAPSLSVASTVREKHTKRGNYALKTDYEIAQILAGFDPAAQTKHVPQYHVLLTTDAFGIGVNLQNAHAVINYDLAWTPIEPAQRAGRILRLFPSPRTIRLYTLTPKPSAEVNHQKASQRLFQRWNVLTTRHGQFTRLMELPTLATEPEHDIQMAHLAGQVSVQLMGEMLLEAIEVSSILQHTALLEQPANKKAAQGLPDDIVSAMLYQGKRSLLYMLLAHNSKYYWPLYDIERGRLLPSPLDISTVLNYIACKQDTPTALADPLQIEHWSNACLAAWCRQMHTSDEYVTQICTLYLIPQDAGESVQTLLIAPSE